MHKDKPKSTDAKATEDERKLGLWKKKRKSSVDNWNAAEVRRDLECCSRNGFCNRCSRNIRNSNQLSLLASTMQGALNRRGIDIDMYKVRYITLYRALHLYSVVRYSLGRIYIVLSDDVERRLRLAIVIRLGGKKGNLSGAVEDAVKDWLRKDSSKFGVV